MNSIIGLIKHNKNIRGDQESLWNTPFLKVNLSDFQSLVVTVAVRLVYKELVSTGSRKLNLLRHLFMGLCSTEPKASAK